MFRKTLSTGSRIGGKFFLLAFVTGASTEEPKIGTIISSKISKKAVVRNRIKRAVYDSVRKFLEEVPKESILVFLAKRLAAQATKEEINNDIYSIMVKFVKK